MSCVRYDFGITAWSVLLIKSRGAEDVSSVYVFLSTHGEALGILVASAPIGGFVEGLIGSNALRIGRNKVYFILCKSMVYGTECVDPMMSCFPFSLFFLCVP